MAHKMADEKSEATLKAAFSVFDTSGDGLYALPIFFPNPRANASC